MAHFLITCGDQEPYSVASALSGPIHPPPSKLQRNHYMSSCEQRTRPKVQPLPVKKVNGCMHALIADVLTHRALLVTCIYASYSSSRWQQSPTLICCTETGSWEMQGWHGSSCREMQGWHGSSLPCIRAHNGIDTSHLNKKHH